MKKVMISIIKFYKRHISVFFKKCGVECIYYPTCSEYAIQAYEKYGFFKGTFLTIKRLFRCNPFAKGGYDPLK